MNELGTGETYTFDPTFMSAQTFKISEADTRVVAAASFRTFTKWSIIKLLYFTAKHWRRRATMYASLVHLQRMASIMAYEWSTSWIVELFVFLFEE